MALPGNGIFVVKGEMAILMTAMKRGARWSHSHQDEELDGLMKCFQELKEMLNKIDDLRLLEPNVYLNPFLDVIRSEETTGPVTSLALSAVNKFLSYGLIDPTHNSVPAVVDNIADAVTHARFVGTDQSSDGVVLMKILQVLRTLTLAPEGAALTNDSLCEIMLSCFRICFETRLNELLRRTAEHYLKDMVQLVFMRLPQFPEDFRMGAVKQLKMKPGAIEQTRTKRRNRTSFRGRNKVTDNKTLQASETSVENEDFQSPILSKPTNLLRVNPLSTTPMTPGGNIVDMQGSISQATPQQYSEESDVASPSSFSEKSDLDSQSENTLLQSNIVINVQSPSSLENIVEDATLQNEENGNNAEEDKKDCQQEKPIASACVENSENLEIALKYANQQSNTTENEKSDTYSITSTIQLDNISETKNSEIQEINQHNGLTHHDYVNPRGIRFTPQNQESIALHPYGLVCIREMFRFLITLCNPYDKQNTDAMIHLGLSLLTVAFEVGADNIGKYSSLLALVKDELCRNLFSLMSTERISVFAADLQVSFLMFESLRTHLKFQLEFYLTKLIEIITSDSLKVTYEHKEIALDNIVQLWRIPGLVTELYLNYDCDIYCTNLYEDLTKLLAKNAFPASSGIYHTHLLSLDALLTVIESIEEHCIEKTKGKLEICLNNCDLKSDGAEDTEKGDGIISLKRKSARLKLSERVPTREELFANKNIKRWLPTGTEYFNLKPKKGIQFLQEHGVLKLELDPNEVVIFLRDNPSLDKKMIGEYISGRNNLQVLEAFVKMFDFTDTRVDEALRLYLETFRLPGEAPLISLLLEHFAEHWHKCNGEPFANADAAFTLAYAIIMLNVDQHNHNVKKQSVPMTADDFKKNLKKVNGGNDFDQDMLDDMYNAIKNEEIVMPAEQTGLVRENYLWKVLLRRGVSKDGVYIHVSSDIYNYDLFSLIWGPIIAALSFVFDKSEDPVVYKRAVRGFERCAFISSHFGITKNLDMLILGLCKFTLFHNQQNKTYGAVQFGSNIKAQLALKTLFNLTHQHGDNIREGWKNIFDLILSLYSHNFLPKSYMEAEDFIEPSGKITMVCETVQYQKQDTGLFSSLYSYMVSSSENLSKIPTPEEQELIDVGKQCVRDCNLEQLITDSKFLHEDALLQLIKALVDLSRGPDIQKSLGYNYNENVSIFFLELLLKIVIQNRDRVMTVWQIVRDHLYTLVMNASHCDYQYLLERSVIGLLRLAIRLMRNEEMSPIVLQSLRMLLLLKSATLFRISRQISYGLYELLKTSAQNIHTSTDWSIIFTLLECVGAGAQPPKPMVDDNQADQGAKSEGEGPASSEDETVSTDRGYTSDSELTRSPRHSAASRSQSAIVLPVSGSTSQLSVPNNTGGWILVGNEGEVQPVLGRTLPADQYSLSLERNLGPHDPSGLVKCCESLAFLVRDVAHITPYNFDNCVHCIRTFVEASLHGSKKIKRSSRDPRTRRKTANRRRETSHRSPATSSPDEDESDDEHLPSAYHQISIQLLDLMHTLHTRTAQIFRWWAEEGGEIAQEMSLWTQGWCPLLQGIARLCCDTRKQVRMSAITYLQRALLVHDLQTLNGPEWEACFHRVLFPLLMLLLQPIGPHDPQAMEETRMRAATVLSKVFLHHLTPLLSLPTFMSLWLTILDFMDKYMYADRSDLLYEAIPESLKNMLLVMDSAKVFEGQEGPGQLWMVTWERIGMFLPHMKEDLFRERDALNNVELQTEQQLPPVTVVQHNIENATRSSIILQPPCSEQNIASPLFAHLGQMVSTPIGAPTLSSGNLPNIPTPYPISLQQPVPILPPKIENLPTPPQNTVQTPVTPASNSVMPVIRPTSPSSQSTLPYMTNMPNLLANTPSLLANTPSSQGHTFPILYNASTVMLDVQPMSIYSEYIGNPYNIAVPDGTPEDASFLNQNQNIFADSFTKNKVLATAPPLDNLNCIQTADLYQNNVTNNLNLQQTEDLNKNTEISNSVIPAELNEVNLVQQNMFQSSNYFYNDSSSNFIPPGSEILFGTEQNMVNLVQGVNIPILSNPNLNTS